MLDEQQARSLAEKVVNAAKSTAHVDTGALKRSISFTFVKGEIIFRQLFYGVYYQNSLLEKYAKKYIPNGQPWKIILTKFGGEIVEVGKTRGGRSTKTVKQEWNSARAKQTTENIRRAIEASRAKKAKEEAENGEA